MNTFRLRLTAAALAIAATFTGLAPAQAFQMPAVPAAAASNALTDVQYRDGDDRRRFREARRDFRDDRRDFRRDRRELQRERYGWYNGHRGYRDRRPGYRYYNGYWFPLAAFATGAIIGGAISADRGGYSSRHVAWCESRYRTYRASDNTYVPRVGVRAQCVSPYS